MNKAILIITSLVFAMQPSLLMAQASGAGNHTAAKSLKAAPAPKGAQGSGNKPAQPKKSTQSKKPAKAKKSHKLVQGNSNSSGGGGLGKMIVPMSLLALIPFIATQDNKAGGLLNSGSTDNDGPTARISSGGPYTPPIAQSAPTTITPRGTQATWPASWQMAFMESMNSSCGRNFRELDSSDGIRQICGVNPGSMSTAQKNLVKMALFQNLAFEESGNNPMSRGPWNGDRRPRGILQLDKQSMGGYDKSCCPITSDAENVNSQNSAHNPIASIRCGVTIASKFSEQDGLLAAGYSGQDSSGALGRYWQPMQNQDIEKKTRIYEKTAKFCQQLLGASPGNLAAQIGVPEAVIAAAGGRSATAPIQVAADSPTSAQTAQATN